MRRSNMNKPNLRNSQSEESSLVHSDDTTTAMFDKATIEQLVRDMTPLLVPLINNSVQQVFEKNLADIAANVDGLKKQNDELNTRVVLLENSIEGLRQNESALTRKVENLEQYSRRNNLIIVGLDITSYSEAAASTRPSDDVRGNAVRNDDSVVSTVLSLFNGVMGLSLRTDDISAAHRLQTNRTGPTRTHSTVIVRFSSVKVRDQVYYSRTQLKNYMTNRNTRVYINEHLTEVNSLLFKRARELQRAKKISNTWTAQGSVYVKTGVDRNAVVKRIQDVMDLDNFQ